MKNRSVTIYAGGGGSRSTGKSCTLGINVIQNSERSERDSGSDKCSELPVSLDRSRNKFGMTPPVKVASCLGWSLKGHVQPLWMALSAFTMAARLSRSTESVAERLPQLNPSKNLAFTMAEILLSLTIIGVVAAITLPSLTGNINERTWNTQRKALYARFSQAIALMPALNGYGTLTEGDSSTSAEDTAAETFVTAGLSKVLKINNICDSEHLEDCGIVSQITNLQASKVNVPTTLVGLNPMFNSTFIGGPTGSGSFTYSQLDTKAAAFETANGESIIVYYNPACQSDLAETEWNYRQAKMCANFIYDLNGSKGPNTFGKDIGVITVLYPSDSSVVAPIPASVRSAGSSSQRDAGKLCLSQDSESRVPNRDELAAVFYNRVMFGLPGSGYFWTSSVIDSSNGWGQSFYTGRAATLPRTGGYNVWCVKR